MNSVVMYRESGGGFTVVFENVMPDTKNIFCAILNGAMKKDVQTDERTKNANEKGQVLQDGGLKVQFFQDGDDFVIRFRNGDMGLFNIMKSLTKAIIAEPAQSIALEIPEDINPTHTKDMKELVSPEEFRSVDELDEQMAQTALEARMNVVFDSIFKKYDGKRPYDILSSENCNVQSDLGNITYLIRRSPYLCGTLYDASVDAVLKYLKSTWGNIGDPYSYAGAVSEEEVNDFFTYYEYVIPDEIKKNLSDQAGVKDYKSWKESSSLTQKKSAMAELLYCIINKPETLF